MKPQDWLFLKRIVRFGDIDSAGVIHFHHLMRWCHEAWEESMAIYGIKSIDIFPSVVDNTPTISTALPIVHCEADYFSPIRLGDQLIVRLIPRKLDVRSFEVKYILHREKDKNVASALIRHFAINPSSPQPCELPEVLDRWLEASSVNQPIRNL